MTKWVCTRTGDTLQHHGKKGMKWGRRLYQNPDGSLTPAGRLRYRKNAERDERRLAGDAPRKLTADDYKNTLNTTKAINEGVETVRKFKSDNDKMSDPDMERRIRKNATQMTDKELQQKVQRLNMEDNYTRMMMHREQLERGESFVNKALDVSSTALKGAATALTIAVALKELKKKS